MHKVKILELGCGQGFHASVLARNIDTDVIGVDLSSEDIEIAKKRYPKVKFEVGDAENLRFEDNSFNLVYAMDVLEHVDNIEQTAEEINRVLKKNGQLICKVPAEKSEKWLLRLRPTYHREIHHVRIYKDDELEVIMKKSSLVCEVKKREGFIQHLELYYLFTRKQKSETQLSIGDWRASFASKLLHSVILFSDSVVFSTPLKYVPLWIIGIPVGYLINLVGNVFFPKSIYYEFRKL